MRRFSHCVALLLLGVIVASVSAYADDEETPAMKVELEVPDHPIDVNKESATNKIAIKWKHDVDVDDWFKDKDIGLAWVYDLDEQWSVYEAESVEAANAIMTDILRILSGKPVDGPLANPEIRHEIKECIGGVVGNNVYVPFPAQPAVVPTECGNPLPNACPTDGLWGLNTIKAPSVWNALPGVVNEKPSEAVLVIDTGVRTTHQDLVGNLVPDLTVQYVGGNPSTVTDGDGHGTHVAGTIFAKWNNGKDSAVGVVGRALGGVCGCGTPRLLDGFCLTRCVNFATENGVRVINLSFGGQQTARLRADDPTRRAYKRFCDAGGLAIAAAGNGNKNIIEPGNFNYPQTLAADLEGINPKCILNVANIEKTGVLAASSDYGEYVKIAAPGTDILSAGIASDTATITLSGTSMAAPHVSGMATLLFNAFPGTAPARVYDCIVSSAKSPVQANPAVTKPKPVNGGIADLQAAYECLRENPTCPTTGLPPCVDPKSGTPVRTCSTKYFCKELNAEYVCQYNYAVDGTLCQNNATGIFAKVAGPELSKMGLTDKPSGDAAASIMRVKYGSKKTRSGKKSKEDKADYTDSKRNTYDNTYDKDATEYKPKSDSKYNAKDTTDRKYKHKGSSGYNKDTSEHEYKSKSDDDYNTKDTYDSNDYGEVEKPKQRKIDYHESHKDYSEHHLQTCGVCRQGQCVSEYREWCKEPKHTSSYEKDEKEY